MAGVLPRPETSPAGPWAQAGAITRSWSCRGSTAERGRRAERGSAPAEAGARPPGDKGNPGRMGRRGKVPRPPPHLARRGHGLALAPRPPRRGLPARPLRPAAAAGGESTQALTLSLGNGCRKVPAVAISPSSRGVPGALLRPPTAPGEFWGWRWSARGSSPRPRPSAPAHPVCRTSPSAARPYHPSLRGDTRFRGCAQSTGTGYPGGFRSCNLRAMGARATARGHPRVWGQESLRIAPPRCVEIRALTGICVGNRVS